MPDGRHLVLVADGSPERLGSIRQTLLAARPDLEVHAAGSFDEYRAALGDRLPDVCVVHLSLTGDRLAELLSDASRRPIVLMAGPIDIETAVSLLRDGISDLVVESPAAFEKIPAVVERALGEWQQRQQRLRDEAELRQSERLLVESQWVARLGHYDFDASTGLWTSSQVLDEIFGIDAGFTRDVSGWIRIVHPDERDEMFAYLTTSVIERGLPFDRQYRILRVGDGVERWVHGRGRLERDRTGRVVRMLGVIQDVTEAKLTEQALQEKSRELEAFFTNAQELLCFADTDGLFRRLNPEWERVLGYRTDQLEGRSFFDLVHPDDLDATRAATRELGAQKQVLDFTNRFRARDGSYRSLEWRSFPAGKLIYAAARDVTERRRAEAARLELERRLLHSQKLESLGVLAGGIAHDFNNLLMGILANLELATGVLAAQSTAVAAIEKAVLAARRAADLTRQMLAYSGQGGFQVTRVDLNALVEENAGLFRSVVARSATLSVVLSDQEPAIDADAGQAQQVVMNLITNAADALGGRPGVVTVSTGLQDFDADALAASRIAEKPAPGRFAYVEVADTGSGMDPQTLERLFDPFFTTKFAGRGLGMSVVLGIVRGHKGAILIDSAPGRGSAIRVLFPASRTSRTEVGPEQLGMGAAAGAAAHGRLLVVDDEAVVLGACLEYLRHRGYDAVGAESGTTALSLFRAEPSGFACVVLDLTMPEMGGAAVFAEMLRIRPEVPVILASGFSEAAALQDFGAARPAGFLQKPFRLEALVATIEGVLAR